MHIHLLGIGGIAMGNLAAMLKQCGHKVTGSDQNLYPPMSNKLRDWSIPVEKFSAKNLQHVDLCIVGNAISRGNVEVEAMLNQNILYMSMPQALDRFFLQTKQTIVVAGTHGKTTTTFLLEHILHSAHAHSSLFAGGVRGDNMDGFRLGKGPYFVIEGDEYDSAFFDKRAKFLHYRPRYLLLTSIEYDHADIYADAQSYEQAFQRLLHLVPAQGLVIACRDCVKLPKLLKNYTLAPVQWYSTHAKTISAITKCRPPVAKTLPILQHLSFIDQLNHFPLLGAHNRANALAAILLASHLGIPRPRIQAALSSFPGVLRRQQIRLDYKQDEHLGNGALTFIEDFAHHPSAVKASLDTMREAYPKRIVHLLFEPRSATSHRNIFQEAYVKQFSKADYIYLTQVFQFNKVSARERLQVQAMVKQINHNKQSQRNRRRNNTRQNAISAFLCA